MKKIFVFKKYPTNSVFKKFCSINKKYEILLPTSIKEWYIMKGDDDKEHQFSTKILNECFISIQNQRKIIINNLLKTYLFFLI